MTRLFAYVAVMAGVTYLIRCIPLLAYQKKITNQFVQSFLYYVPYAVLGAMTFPAIFTSGGELIPSLLGTGTAIILAYQKRSLITVAIAASVVVYLASLFL